MKESGERPNGFEVSEVPPAAELGETVLRRESTEQPKQDPLEEKGPILPMRNPENRKDGGRKGQPRAF